jgi:hypothetical protein
MRRLKVGGRTAAHPPEHRRHRPLTWSKDGAGEEGFHRLPHGSRKDRGNDSDALRKAIGKESMAILSVAENMGFHGRSILTQIAIIG